MENITLELLLYLAAGAALGGYVNGLAGFGTGLMSLGIWLQVMSVEEAVQVVAAMSVVSGVQSLWLTRQGVKTGLHRLPRFLVPALIGLPVGAWLLNWIDAAHLKLTVAFFMLFYTAFFLLRGQLAKAFTKERPFCDGLAGFTGGVMGGAASLSGVVPTMWCALQPWDKFQTSAVLRPYNVVILTLAFIWYLAAGHVTLMTWIFTAIAFPVTLIFFSPGSCYFSSTHRHNVSQRAGCADGCERLFDSGARISCLTAFRYAESLPLLRLRTPGLHVLLHGAGPGLRSCHLAHACS